MRIARAALILSFGNILSRLLGLAREQTIAALFGRTAVTDAFTAAWRIPTTLYDLLVGGMISAALVPVLAEARDNEADFARLISVLLTMGALVLALTMAAVVLVAEPLMALWAGGLGDRGPAGPSAVLLLRLMVPALFFMGLSGITTAVLYSQERFLLPALAGSAFNAAIVIGAFVLYRQLDILSLCAGLVLGGAAQLAVQLPGLRRTPLRAALDFRHPALRRIVALYLPVALGLLVSAVGVGIDTRLASTTPPGDMTAMRYATTLVQFPLGLIAAALSFAVLPSLSRASDDFGETLGIGLRLAWLAIVPAAIGLVILREPVIRLLFQRGAFGPEDTTRTALAFLFYSPGIPAAAIDQMLIFAFYARKNTITPVLVGVAAVGVYLVCGVALVRPFGMAGLAAANSLQWITHAALMAALIRRVVPPAQEVSVLSGVWRPFAAAGIMAACLVALDRLLGTPFAERASLTAGLYLMVAVVFGGGIYVGMLAVLGTPELARLKVLLRAGTAFAWRRDSL